MEHPLSKLQLFFGGSALSNFRRDQLLIRARKQLVDRGIDSAHLQSLECNFLYAIWVEKPLDLDATKRIQRLLEHDALDGVVAPLEQHASWAEFDQVPSESSICSFVSPRAGTISPWSTKATNIFQNCGVIGLKRIERIRFYQWQLAERSIDDRLKSYEVCEEVCRKLAFDRMVEDVWSKPDQLLALFTQQTPQQLKTIPVLSDGHAALVKANSDLGLALADDEVDYLVDAYQDLKRDPTDAELMMFAQANSEHCRHKIFNASWTVDGKAQENSLFGMIKNTYANNPKAVLSAYSDNAAVMSGTTGDRLYAGTEIGQSYQYNDEPIHYLLKVETHNHPTAISPFPGAATGAGGEIRDEGATGKGAKPKGGMTGFSVSNLKIPGFEQPWEKDIGKPNRIVSALDIMLEGPIGGAAFNNEFGRPNLCGYFRSYEQLKPESTASTDLTCAWGYHKPIMIAGGIGNICDEHVLKTGLDDRAILIVLGGPAMLIGLGGGAASSMASGQSSEHLDFASVQRDNPEMERRCQEVIDRCWQLGEQNPIAFIHDVGAGGLSNALPELVKDGGVGGVFSLRDIPNDEPSMAPLAIWCNESQERYVLAVNETEVEHFDAICQRERAPYAVVGKAQNSEHILVKDDHFKNKTVDLPMHVLFGKPPKMHRDVKRVQNSLTAFATDDIEFEDAAKRVLSLPTVASKSFLITIGDRTVSGLVHRDQMVGPWQLPVADAAVTAASYTSMIGEAMAVGERTPLAVINAKASARMAIGEALTNLCSASFDSLNDVVISANWMAACGQEGEDARLYDAVQAVGLELCPALDIAIPVGKDSLSMHTGWDNKSVTAPVSLIATAAVKTSDVSLATTPQLQNLPSDLILVDISGGRCRLGGSAVAQVYSATGTETPDLDKPDSMRGFVEVMQSLLKEQVILAYHDRSDGGLFTSLLEMAAAGRVGLSVTVPIDVDNVIAWAFNEELGAVIQVDRNHSQMVCEKFAASGVQANIVGELNSKNTLDFNQNKKILFSKPLAELHSIWHETSFQIQSLRDNPECAKQEADLIRNYSDTGLFADIPIVMQSTHDDIASSKGAVNILSGAKPKVAILREQGVNSQYEMAAAYMAVGFDSYDVHMSDLQSGRYKLSEFQGLAACGGFSYGDVLGAGHGWANSILFDDGLRLQFESFFADRNRFVLGVCNGCQMLSSLAELIPGTEHWPSFVRNQSEQFEARLVMAEVLETNSPLLNGMAGMMMPIVVSHGEGRAQLSIEDSNRLNKQQLTALRYVDGAGAVTEQYPLNPNGSPQGLAGVVNASGNVLTMMPHPERSARASQFSWYPPKLSMLGYKEYSPWLKIFQNAFDICR